MSLWQISQNCPQCGGPAVIAETDRVFRCRFCSVSLFIVPRDYLKYYIVSDNTNSGDLIYLPYWRLKGTAYTCSGSKVTKRLIERSCTAIEANYLPITLGYRTQTLKLRFLQSDYQGIFIRNKALNRQYIFNIDEGDIFMPDTNEIYHRAFIGDSISIIYAPYELRDGKLYDAVLDRQIAVLDEATEGALMSMERCEGWQVRFIPTVCPDCGWDMRCEGDSVVLPCPNCDTLWEVSQEKMQKINTYIMPSQEGNAMYLPFWRLDLDFKGVKLDSFTDMARLANLPRVFKKGWDDVRPYFWSPAFKVTPEVFLRLTRQLTLMDPLLERFNLKDATALPSIISTVEPANLSLSNALESVKITMANFSSDRKNFYPRLREIDLSLRECQIVYLPFKVSGGELIQDALRFSIHRNSLKTGRML